MIEQRTLFEVERRRDPTMRERFERFHRKNPHVYDALRRMSLAMARAGRRCGIATLYETLRWRYLWTAGDDFKLNNNWRAFYARLLMEREPELDGFFDVREQRTA